MLLGPQNGAGLELHSYLGLDHNVLPLVLLQHPIWAREFVKVHSLVYFIFYPHPCRRNLTWGTLPQDD